MHGQRQPGNRKLLVHARNLASCAAGASIDFAGAARRVVAPVAVRIGGAELPAVQERARRKLENVLVSRSEEHMSELQSLAYLVCRLLLEKKKNQDTTLPHLPARQCGVGR